VSSTNRRGPKTHLWGSPEVLISVIALKIQLRLDQVVRHHWRVGRIRFGIGRLAGLETSPKIGLGLQIGSTNRVPSPKDQVSL
jgi:hypothetical protein